MLLPENNTEGIKAFPAGTLKETAWKVLRRQCNWWWEEFLAEHCRASKFCWVVLFSHTSNCCWLLELGLCEGKPKCQMRSSPHSILLRILFLGVTDQMFWRKMWKHEGFRPLESFYFVSVRPFQPIKDFSSCHCHKTCSDIHSITEVSSKGQDRHQIGRETKWDFLFFFFFGSFKLYSKNRASQ